MEAFGNNFYMKINWNWPCLLYWSSKELCWFNNILWIYNIIQIAQYFKNENNLYNEENSQKIQCKCLFIHGRLDTLTIEQIKIKDLSQISLPAHIKDESYLQIQEEMTHNQLKIKDELSALLLSRIKQEQKF
ncbi:unnamed protein product [Paramecium sonneborni]|nr:unnamed protein product [Paramecium sonneborni]